ncbi:DUF1385 domain-containing protein [bacterium]|nr:DUF1385 domain-containing protein [candidate division CSSED10-310 bacterium]
MAKILVGGQAVLEGVMMRAPGIMSVAVRRMDGSIEINRSPIISLADRFPILRWPFFRGIIALGQALILGFKALNYSSAIAIADIDCQEDDTGILEKKKTVVKTESLSTWSVVGVILMTLVLGIGFFFLLPLYLTELMGKLYPSINTHTVIFNLVDGIIRVFFLLIYVVAISLIPEIKKVFQYHGAEHKSIFAYEAGLPLTVENAKQFPTLHPRCGTAFLLMVMIVAIFVFSLIPSDATLFTKITLRIGLLPLIAATSFELIKLAGESRNVIMRILIQPGLWLQRITTKEPDDKQLEVGIAALNAALSEYKPDSKDIII